MKLVNILARDWTTWPYDHAAFVSQDSDRDTAAFAIGDQRVNANGNWYGDSYISGSLVPLKELADDHQTAIVTYDEWEIARETVTGAWNGEGLPPVGLEVEARFPQSILTGWTKFTLMYLSDQTLVYKTLNEVSCEPAALEHQGVQFRPIRTPEQIAAEERKLQREQLAYLIAGYMGFDDPRETDTKLAAYIFDHDYRKTDVK